VAVTPHLVAVNHALSTLLQETMKLTILYGSSSFVFLALVFCHVCLYVICYFHS